MKNNNSLKYLHLITNSRKRAAYNSHTPIIGKYPSIKEKLFESRNNSPESKIKLQSQIEMYKNIKRSLTPIKDDLYQNSESVKIFKKPKDLPFITTQVTKVSVKEYGIGNEYAKALSSTIKVLPNLKELNIRNNRITDEGTSSLLGSLNKTNMKILDLSYNTLGLNSVNSVVEIISDFTSSIEKLSLESTRLSFPFLVKLSLGLKSNHSIQELSLAGNKLGMGCGVYLKEFLLQTTTLKRLDLHWNLIQGFEAVMLLEGIKGNDTVRSLDLSWNSIGSTEDAVKALCDVLENESQLEHLDISYNRISFLSAEKIGKVLEGNHTLLGLHVEGNSCKVDHLGFLTPCHQNEYPSLKKSARIIRTPKKSFGHNCWICNKYMDYFFTWDPSSVMWKKNLKEIFTEKNQSKELVYLHLDIEGYDHYHTLPDENGCFVIKRAVPSNKAINFFFSYRGHAQISFDYPAETLPKPYVKTIDGQQIVVKAVNYFSVFEGELTSKPRFPPKVYQTENTQESSMIVSEWSFDKSQFSNYAWDTDNLINDCFEFDWKNSKILRIIKNEKIREQVKEIIRPYYKYIKKIYKYYSALGTSGNIFSINLALLTELCQKSDILDKNFKISDIDLQLKASKFSLNSVNTAYGLVRHEFLEFLIRVGLDKYYRSGICYTESEALKMFFSNNFSKIQSFDKDKWRWERLFNKECEEVLIEYRDVFQVLFDLNSGKKAKPGEKKFMQIDDFLNICQAHDLMNDTFNIRNATFCFHMSLMTHVDELNGITHTQANKLEFTEAICRVIDYLDSSDPEKEIVNCIYSEVPLDVKISNVMNRSFARYRVSKKGARMT